MTKIFLTLVGCNTHLLGKICTWKTSDPYIDIGTPNQLDKALKIWPNTTQHRETQSMTHSTTNLFNTLTQSFSDEIIAGVERLCQKISEKHGRKRDKYLFAVMAVVLRMLYT